MAVTYEQALTESNFHYAPVCAKHVGPKGGVTLKVERWRSNGATKTWKTRPGEFKVPIKYGMYDYSYLTHENAHNFHVASECPIEELRGW